MSKKTESSEEMRDNYDFSRGTRGKYVKFLKDAGQVVLLEPDVAKAFPTSKAVNESLRQLLPTKRLKSSKK